MASKQFIYDDGYEIKGMSEEKLDSLLTAISVAQGRDSWPLVREVDRLGVGELKEMARFVTVTRIK